MNHRPSPVGVRRGRLRPVLTVVAVGAVVVILVGQRDEILDPLGAVSLGTLLALLGLQTAYQVADSVRYYLAIPTRRRDGLDRHYWHQSFAEGRVLNLVAPQIGTAYRAAVLQRSGLPITAFIGSFAVVSWIGGGVALSGAALAMAIADRQWVGFALAAGVVVASTAVCIVWVRRRAPGVIGRQPTQRWRRSLGPLVESFLDLSEDAPRLRRVVGMSTVVYLLGWVTFVIASRALGVEDAVLTGTVVFSVTTVATSVALTPGSLGIAELAAGGAGTIVGSGAGSGVLISLLTRATGLVSVLIVLIGLRIGGRIRRG